MKNRVFVDIGNTFTKHKVANNYFASPNEFFDLGDVSNIDEIWISNVSKKDPKINHKAVFYAQSQSSYKNLINAYSDYKQLGVDRWLALIGGYEISENRNYLVIDTGTAVTLDLVLDRSTHLGGIIFPGYSKIKSTFPEFKSIKNVHGLLGVNTEESWSLGLSDMVSDRLNSLVHQLKNVYHEFDILVTGGGFDSLKSKVNFPYTFSKHLVIDGLEYYSKSVG